MANVRTDEIWAEIGRQSFCVIGMVSRRGESRTAGVVPAVHDGALWFSTLDQEWKAKHMAANPAVSVTVPIPKRIPFVPWVKIPAATVTFAGSASFVAPEDAPAAVVEPLLHGLDVSGSERGEMVIVRVDPVGDFVTYGVGIPMRKMTDTELSRGRAPVAA